MCFIKLIYKKNRVIVDKILAYFPRLHGRLYRHKLGIKYIISGGTAAAVDFALLYLLTDLIGVWYLYSAIVAYVASFFTSFTMQKFWTFQDSDLKRIRRQFLIYLSAALIGLLLNSIMMYFWVSILHVWYLAAQFITMGILAIGSFFINTTLTFKKIEG